MSLNIPLPCSAAAMCLKEYNAPLYSAIYQHLAANNLYISANDALFSRCTSESKVRAQEAFLRVKGDLQHQHYEIDLFQPAILDIICRASIDDGFTGQVEMENECSNIQHVWKRLLEHSVTFGELGKGFSNFFEQCGSQQRMLMQLLQESKCIEEIILAGKNNAHGWKEVAAKAVLHNTAGHYMIIISDESDATAYRQYVGQSKDIVERIRRHAATARRIARIAQDGGNRPIYKYWNKAGHHVSVIPIHSLADADTIYTDRASWLTIVEMFYSLVFKTLQPKHLDIWLGQSWRIGVHRGLNVQPPLFQGETFRGMNSGIGAIFSSEDPEISQIGKDLIARMSALAKVANKDANYKPFATARYATTGRYGSTEDIPDDMPIKIMMRCNTCKSSSSIREDTHPIFCIWTGQYIVKQGRYEGDCKLSKSEKKAGRNFANKYHTPVNFSRKQYLTAKEFAKVVKQHPRPSDDNPEEKTLSPKSRRCSKPSRDEATALPPSKRQKTISLAVKVETETGAARIDMASVTSTATSDTANVPQQPIASATLSAIMKETK